MTKGWRIRKEKTRINGRKKAFFYLGITGIVLAGVAVGGALCHDMAGETDFARKNLAPCLAYPFGTDWMGRDMLGRTLAGLSLSLAVGMLTAAVSCLLALVLGVAAAMDRRADRVISFLTDLVMGIPHILLLLLVSYACGKGLTGVVTGVALTHWPSLARLLRAEVLSLKNSDYVRIAQKLGAKRFRIVLRHMFPHLFPQFLVGLILTFPHAILHEASITFLGFGLPSEQPAIGGILSESMRYLITGKWWLAAFPGLLLAGVVSLFDLAGNALTQLLNPASAQE